MTKVKLKDIYIYDYPENREIAKGLMAGDRLKIAQETGFSQAYITEIFKGRRKMPDQIRDITRKIIETNREKVAVAATL